jgi:CBS-domain-containing membrane protein
MPLFQNKNLFRIPKKLLRNLIIWSGGTITISLIALLVQHSSLLLLIPPFGATCFIIFFLPQSPFANPLNIIGSHFLTTSIGLICQSQLGTDWWVYGISVGIAMMVMQLTKTMHPPAAGNPLFILMQPPETWPIALVPIVICSLLLGGASYTYRQLIDYRLQRPRGIRPSLWKKIKWQLLSLYTTETSYILHTTALITGIIAVGSLYANGLHH